MGNNRQLRRAGCSNRGRDGLVATDVGEGRDHLSDAKMPRLVRLVCPVDFGQGRRYLPVVCQFNPTERGGDN